MIPFNRTWPYDIIMNDVYVPECPFCRKPNVLIPLKKDDLQDIREGQKKLLVFPCCNSKLTIIDNDPDYLLTDKLLPRK